MPLENCNNSMISIAIRTTIPGGPKVMKHFYEVFLSAKEDWMKSSVMMKFPPRSEGSAPDAMSGSATWILRRSSSTLHHQFSVIC